MPAFGDECVAGLMRLLGGGDLASVGIVNGTNACYMNAALQLLYAMSAVRAAVQANPRTALTRVLRDIFNELGGSETVPGLVASGRYKTIDGAMGTSQTAAGSMGCSDEVLTHLLEALRPTYGGSYSVTKTAYSTCDGRTAVIHRLTVPYLQDLLPGTEATTVQELVDNGALPVEARYAGCTTYTKYERITVDSTSRYVVLGLNRGEGNAVRVGCARLALARDTGGTAAYTLTGAVLYDTAREHYVFVRTSVVGETVRVLRVYDDAAVTDGTDLDVERTARALLFTR
jgi:hypothetical protein